MYQSFGAGGACGIVISETISGTSNLLEGSISPPLLTLVICGSKEDVHFYPFMQYLSANKIYNWCHLVVLTTKYSNFKIQN